MGAICPKGKISKGRRDRRRAQNYTVALATLSTCSRCGELTRAHRACRACGNYNKREIYSVE